MKSIPTFVHGIIDYFMGIVLLLLPNMVGFSDVGPAATVARVFGTLIIVQALSTDYELGVLKVVPMKTHLMLDYAVGILLMVSPWLFRFSDIGDRVTAPFILLGIASIVVTAMTQPLPTTGVRTAGVRGGM